VTVNHLRENLESHSSSLAFKQTIVKNSYGCKITKKSPVNSGIESLVHVDMNSMQIASV
jgi:hypothetical protein